MTPSFTSSVGLWDDIYSEDNIFGAQIIKDETSLYTQYEKFKFPCLVINLRLIAQTSLDPMLSEIKKLNPHCQFIFFEAQNYHLPLISTINTFKIFKILSDRDENLLYKAIVDAKTEYDLSLQNEQLLQLIQEKNIQLRDLNIDLELRIKNRQLSLEDSKLKLIQINKSYSTLLQCLVGIQKANSLNEIEKSLLSSLAEPFRIKIVKIQFQNSGSEIDSSLKNTFKIKIDVDEPFEAFILFFKKPEDTFSKEEQAFLKQISGAVSLAIKKMNNEQLIKDLKQQWQVTFDAIQEPVLLIHENYEILQWNKSVEPFSPQKNNLCYKVLFNRTEPCQGCQLGKSFQLPLQKNATQQESLYSVESEWIESVEQNKIFLNIYRDLSEQKRVERQILESSKMGELGLIGSSIAHELNNPLAGLITFIQMLKADTIHNPSLHKDITDMETAALRCKEIIQNLLSFTRRAPHQNEKLQIREVLNKALRILSVKTKPIGLLIETLFKAQNDLILGQSSALTQSFVNIFQNSIESIELKRKIDSLFNPKIQVEVSESGQNVIIDIMDNGLGLTADQQLKAFTPFYTTKNPEVHRGLGLTVAYQIINDHSGTIDIGQVSGGDVRVRVSLPRLK